MGTDKLLRIGDHVFHIEEVNEDRYREVLHPLDNYESYSDDIFCEKVGLFISSEDAKSLVNMLSVYFSDNYQVPVAIPSGVKEKFMLLLYLFVRRHNLLNNSLGSWSEEDEKIVNLLGKLKDTKIDRTVDIFNMVETLRGFNSSLNFVNSVITGVVSGFNLFSVREKAYNSLKLLGLYKSIYDAKQLEMTTYPIIRVLESLKNECCYMSVYETLYSKYITAYSGLVLESYPKVIKSFNDSFYYVEAKEGSKTVKEVYADLNGDPVKYLGGYDFTEALSEESYLIIPDSTVYKSLSLFQQFMVLEFIYTKICDFDTQGIDTGCIETCDFKDERLKGEIGNIYEKLQKDTELAKTVNSELIWADRLYTSPKTGEYRPDNMHIDEDLLHKKKSIIEEVSEYIRSVNDNTGRFENSFYDLQNRLSSYLSINASEVEGLRDLVAVVNKVSSGVSDVACSVTKIGCYINTALGSINKTIAGSSDNIKTGKDVLEETKQKARNLEVAVKAGISLKVGSSTKSMVKSSVSSKIDAIVDPKDKDYFLIQQAKETVLDRQLSTQNYQAIADCEWLEKYPQVLDVVNDVFESARENLDNCAGENIIDLPALSGIDLSDFSLVPNLNIDLTKPLCKKGQ